jgi:uncharacterized membrane protein YkvA (DUF1232 family)
MFTKAKEKVKKLKQEIVPIYYALFDERTPLSAKIIAWLTVGYLLSPIDLIPDFYTNIGLIGRPNNCSIADKSNTAIDTERCDNRY